MSEALKRARKLLRSRNRRAAGCFLAEGPNVIGEALASGLAPFDVFVAVDGIDDESAALVDRLDAAGVALHQLERRDLITVADTQTPRGIVAVFPEPVLPEQPFADGGVWLVLDRVQDPGNVGTLIRAAEAFGAAGVIAVPGTADPWATKALRAGQGAHFHAPILHGAQALADLEAWGAELWVADTGGDDMYAAPAPPALCGLVVGNEAGGVDEELAARAARRLAVPQRGRTESVNVAMAGAVLLSWLCRESPDADADTETEPSA